MVSVTGIDQPLATAVLPVFVRAVQVSYQLVGTDTTGPYVYSGVVPLGTKVNPNGLITGAPTIIGPSYGSALLITKNVYGDIAIKVAPYTVQ